jgi:hypothetical protein
VHCNLEVGAALVGGQLAVDDPDVHATLVAASLGVVTVRFVTTWSALYREPALDHAGVQWASPSTDRFTHVMQPDWADIQPQNDGTACVRPSWSYDVTPHRTTCTSNSLNTGAVCQLSWDLRANTFTTTSIAQGLCANCLQQESAAADVIRDPWLRVRVYTHLLLSEVRLHYACDHTEQYCSQGFTLDT